MSALPATRADLEALLRERHPHAEAPPLRGTAPRALPLPTGVQPLDLALGGGLPRGQTSEVFGPVSSGRTGVAMGLLVGVTSRGGLAALVDPADRFDPASAHGAGIDLGRLLWVRGPGRNGSTGLRSASRRDERTIGAPVMTRSCVRCPASSERTPFLGLPRRHVNAVSYSRGFQWVMSNDDHDTARCRLENVGNKCFCTRPINIRRGFVHHHNWVAGQQYSRHGDALGLTARHQRTLFPHRRVEAAAVVSPLRESHPCQNIP